MSPTLSSFQRVKGSKMGKTRLLKIYLLTFGLLNVFVISFTVPLAFGDRLLWHPRNIPDEMMLSVLYLAMGIVMLSAARRPEAHKAFIDFLILGNVFHGTVMLVYAEHTLHLLFDVGAIGVMGVAPLFFYPWGLRKFLRYGQEGAT
jgi:integral membrane sensor domain MASE1